MRQLLSSTLTRAIGVMFVCMLARVHGSEMAFTLMPPSGTVPTGGEVLMDLVALNPGAAPVACETSSSLSGQLKTADGVSPVELQATTLGAVEVAPGSFAVRRYRLRLPPDLTGQIVLEVAQPTGASLKAVLEVASPPLVEEPPPVGAPTSQLASSTRAIDVILNRTFAGRLGPNEPIYFIYGSGEESAAKFQFSFSYRLATFDGSEKAFNLHLGYTQRSLWDIDAHSSPFYDTSYMPELFVDTLARAPVEKSGWFTWIGARAGVMHESNGRAGPGSRSLNTFYVRPAFALGPLDSWHLVVFPDFSTYLTSLDDNEDLKDYRGYGRLRMVFGKNNGPSLLFAGWSGKDFNHFTYQLDLAYPVRTKLLDFESFLLLQYFNGYGESLISYDKKSEALRVGLELLR